MSYASQFLKWRMEQVWKQRGCVSPNHLANWSDFERGWRVRRRSLTNQSRWQPLLLACRILPTTCACVWV